MPNITIIPVKDTLLANSVSLKININKKEKVKINNCI
jgi:hypothetical protein